MTPKEKEAIIKKCVELGFELYNDYYICDLPLGMRTSLLLDTTNLGLIIKCFTSYVPIRKIESPEDLENLFNAICPEKYRLPFG